MYSVRIKIVLVIYNNPQYLVERKYLVDGSCYCYYQLFLFKKIMMAIHEWPGRGGGKALWICKKGRIKLGPRGEDTGRPFGHGTL